jgi:outer membrane protein OmpA-like peptidoglycan-associated protein
MTPSRRYHRPEIPLPGGLSARDGQRLVTAVRAAIDDAVRNLAAPVSDVGATPRFLLADLPAATPAGQRRPSRPAGEVARSRTRAGILSKNVEYDPARGQLDIVDFAVGGSVLPPDVTDDPGWQWAMSVITGDPSILAAVTGYTDSTGTAGENLALRQQRADAVVAAMPAAVRAKVLRGPHDTTEFLDTNATPEGRAHNRAVRVTFASGLPVGRGDRFDQARNLDEYVFLVQAMEQRLNLTGPGDARTALSVLRQIYYGSAAWSASRHWVWDRVITQHPWSAGNDPTAALHPPLIRALKRSKEIEGVDIGHVLTGIDAMLAPGEVVVSGQYTNVSNEDWATWAGDVGSAAAEWAMAAWLERAGIADFGTFFDRYAGTPDLLGDIDAFALRAGENGAKPWAQLMRPIELAGPLSSVLRQYFRVTSSAPGSTRLRRAESFVEAFGGVVVDRRITNRDALVARLRQPIEQFATLYVFARVTHDFPDPPPNRPPVDSLIRTAVDDMVPRFVDWLATELSRRSESR